LTCYLPKTKSDTHRQFKGFAIRKGSVTAAIRLAPIKPWGETWQNEIRYPLIIYSGFWHANPTEALPIFSGRKTVIILTLGLRQRLDFCFGKTTLAFWLFIGFKTFLAFDRLGTTFDSWHKACQTITTCGLFK